MWSKDLEKVISKLGDDAILYEKLHESRALYLRSINNGLRHSSTFLSFCSAGLLCYDQYEGNDWARIASICGATLSAIFNAILSRNKIEENISRHEFASKEYNKISFYITSEFIRKPEERTNGTEFVKKVLDKMQELYTNSPIVEKKMTYIVRGIDVRDGKLPETIEIQMRQ